MQGTGSRRPPLASSAPPGLPRRPFTSWFQEHVWALPALFSEARFSGDWPSRVGARGRRARVPQWPRLLGFGRGLEVPVLSRRSLDLKHLGGCSPDSASGCPACRRRCWGRMAAFQASSLYGSRRPHPLPPAAGKVGGGRGRAGGLPRPLRHPSGGRGVIHPSNGLGCGEWGRLWGGGPAGPEIGCCRPPQPPYPARSAGLLESPGAATGEVLGKLGIR